MKKLVVTLISLILVGTAQASFSTANFPNNTGTYLAQQQSLDGVIGISSSYISSHLYGRDLVIDLYVANLSAAKDIYIVKGQGTSSSDRWQAYFGEDYWNANAAASWKFTTQDQRDNFHLRIKGFHTPNTVYTIYVVMNGQTYSNQFYLQ
ncbi:MAG: hypothetical protein KDD61_08580 [Bdellovibrionales bacterium]|nr:hypothetical protein [Bdellovibrionales bacterium]